MTHRAWSAGAAGALVALAVLLGAPPALAAPSTQGSVLALNPKHGRPAAPFVAAFKVTSSDHKCPVAASFWWDGIPMGNAPFSSTCVASKTIVPPQNDRTPGMHTVTAATESGTLSASDSYTIDLVTSPSPTPSPTPKSTPTTGAPTPSETRATPTTPAPTDSALFSPELETPAAAPVVVAPTSATPAASSGRRSSLSALALAGGGGLVLVGVVAMGLLFLSSRRREADDDLGDGIVDLDAETQTDMRPVGLDGLLPRRAPLEAPPQPETG